MGRTPQSPANPPYPRSGRDGGPVQTVSRVARELVKQKKRSVCSENATFANPLRLVTLARLRAGNAASATGPESTPPRWEINNKYNMNNKTMVTALSFAAVACAGKLSAGICSDFCNDTYNHDVSNCDADWTFNLNSCDNDYDANYPACGGDPTCQASVTNTRNACYSTANADHNSCVSNAEAAGQHCLMFCC
jgi:hypothetical protein